jgi:hypothetical protein
MLVSEGCLKKWKNKKITSQGTGEEIASQGTGKIF